MTATVHIENVLPWAKGLWSLFVLVGVVTNAVTFRAAWVDFRHVKRATHDPAKHIRAWQSLRDEFVTLAFQMLVLYVRFWSMFWPDPGNDVFALRWLVDATVLTAGQLLLAFNCVLDMRDRRRTIDHLPPYAR